LFLFIYLKLNKDRLYLIAVNKDRFTVEFECFVYHVKALVCYMISTLNKKKNSEIFYY